MKKIKEIIHTFSFSRLLFPTIFSIALFYMSKINFLGYVYEGNFIDLVFFNEFIILLALIPITYLLLCFIENNYNRIINNIICEKVIEHKKLFCLVTFIFLLIIYLVYYFSFYPGGVYVDTWTSFRMLLGEDSFSNQQPVFYTFMLNIVKLFSPDLYLGFGIFTFIQILVMVATFTYFIYWLLNKKVNSLLVTIIVLFLGFFKLYPLYSVSVWKDTPFSLALLLYTLTLIDLLFDFNNKTIKISNIVKFNIFTLLVLLLRNNGLYICLGISSIIVIIFIVNIIRKNHIKNNALFTISSILTIIVFLIIESFYPLLGIDTSSSLVESIAIPIQQVARVIVADANITDEQKDLVQKVIPIKNLKESYRTMLVDPLKWNSEFNSEYLEEHLSDYFKLWLELLIQNPDEYFKAYLLQTSGFWTFNVVGSEAYHSATTWPSLEEIQNIDLIAENSYFSFKENLLKVPYYSGGFFFWITALSILITFRNCKKKYLFGYLPSILLWLTVMISTPMASALRYVYILVLILPLNFVYPAIVKTYEENFDKK